jgi:hypothetical protein
MRRRDDDFVDFDMPFFRLHLRGGGRQIVFGNGDADGEDVIDMDQSTSDEYWSVRRRVRRRLRFVRHLFTFLVLNGVFVLLDWRTGGAGNGINWSQWVALVWGIFLGWEFISHFVAPQLWGREAEERLIEREMRRRHRAEG